MAKIILGLYKNKAGTIEYLGVPVKKENLSSYRSKFSAVFTDSYVFKELDHIDHDLLAEKGQELIDLLELSKKVKIVDQGFTTKSLSDGQKKKTFSH